MKIVKIILYDEPSVPEIKLKNVVEFLKKVLATPIQIEIKNNFFQNSNDHIFERIAKTQIFDLKKKFTEHNPTTVEILNEKKNYDNQIENAVLHEGLEFQKVIIENIPWNDDKNTLHIIFTDKIVCTYDKDTARYHARIWIGPNPVIISTTGIIEAPAKPKQYYYDIMTNFSKKSVNEIKRKYKGEFLEYHDSRISDILEGILLQIITHQETGEGFCDDSNCRLFNSHWQKELLLSQIENKKMCEKHKKLFKEITE